MIYTIYQIVVHHLLICHSYADFIAILVQIYIRYPELNVSVTAFN